MYRRTPLRAKLHEFFTTNVREDILLEAELLLLAFATGIGDATTYSEYRVFTANHTGNTLLLAVGSTEDWGAAHGGRQLVGGIPIPLKLIAISLSMFIMGGWIPGQLGNLLGSRQRWWLMANNFFQCGLVLGASIIQAVHPRATTAIGVVVDRRSMAVVALLALSAGGQVAVARSLRMTEITTANATSAYVDLLIDKDLFRPNNRGRNRRLSFLLSLSLGSFTGGFLYQSIGPSDTLFISAATKFMVTILLFFNEGGYWEKECYCKKGFVGRIEDASKSDLNS